MNILKSIILNTNDDEIKISTPIVEANRLKVRSKSLRIKKYLES
jgi:hypothetical protein